jgi:hypothetical protein
MVEDFYLLLNKLHNKIPFSFAHFNDGEMSFILDCDRTPISRGYQDYSEELKIKLKEAFLINNKEFYRGIPCSTCYHHLRQGALQLLKDNNTICSITMATLFHNSFVTTNRLVCETLKNYTITWVINDRYNIEHICNRIGLDVTKSKTIIVPSRNAFGTEIDENFDTEMVIFLCGPIGRILAGTCFEKHPSKTFLCLGSYFDYVFGTVYQYHVSDKMCSECCFRV